MKPMDEKLFYKIIWSHLSSGGLISIFSPIYENALLSIEVNKNWMSQFVTSKPTTKKH